MSSPNEMNFENAIARLEQIVRALESGSAPLDDSLALFEEGVRLVKLCNDKLDSAESRIKLLTETPSGVVESDFPKGGQNGN
ncbi:MAG: exodeoxyribonuclease VII small subunit [Clostridia bacterium]|nr:exodeoxyribonuclease VII small subunit [Clostridia bacterium]